MPTTDRKLRVFLCHASQDKPIVRELYQRLLAEGWIDPWLDEEKLLPGQDWEYEINKFVEYSDAVIVFLSKAVIDRDGYIQKEIRKVLDVADEKPEGTIFVIPIRLNDCNIPHRLLRYHYLNYFPDLQQDLAHQLMLKSLQTRAQQLDIWIFDDFEFFGHERYQTTFLKSTDSFGNLVRQKEYGWAKASGDSMNATKPIPILESDFVLFYKSSYAEDNAIVIASCRDERSMKFRYVIKRYDKANKLLISDTKLPNKYPPMPLGNDTIILGVVIAISKSQKDK